MREQRLRMSPDVDAARSGINGVALRSLWQRRRGDAHGLSRFDPLHPPDHRLHAQGIGLRLARLLGVHPGNGVSRFDERWNGAFLFLRNR